MKDCSVEDHGTSLSTLHHTGTVGIDILILLSSSHNQIIINQRLDKPVVVRRRPRISPDSQDIPYFDISLLSLLM